MGKKELMELNTLANQCGFFYNKEFRYPDLPDVNNGYNCDHPEQKEYEEIEGKRIGKCYSFSCPLAYEADREDCENLGEACEGCDSERECELEMMVVEYDDNGNIIPLT